MPYQYKQEPLRQKDTNRLAQASKTHEEKLTYWTLSDIGLRVKVCLVLGREEMNNNALSQ